MTNPIISILRRFLSIIAIVLFFLSAIAVIVPCAILFCIYAMVYIIYHYISYEIHESHP